MHVQKFTFGFSAINQSSDMMMLLICVAFCIISGIMQLLQRCGCNRIAPSLPKKIALILNRKSNKQAFPKVRCAWYRSLLW